MNEIAAGSLLAGKYRLEALIGRGGMGSVWRAEHLGLSAPVAVKLLDLLHFGGAGEAVARFHREARAAAAIRSPHVVQILDHGVDPTFNVPFIVMELMEGESLANRLARSGRISLAEVARVFAHVARALSRAHEAGIVHRDLKPDNVFLVRNEDDEVAKVLDFGIAKADSHALGQDSGTRTGAIMGTAYYMSPEQISGSKLVDYRTDLWALGVMACECLTGRRPFEAESIGGITLKICVEPIPLPSSLGPVPAGFDAWFAKIVNRDPGQRFPSARAAADALRQICSAAGAQVISDSFPQPSAEVRAPNDRTVTSLSVSAHEQPPSAPAKRRSALPWLLAMSTLAALGTGGWFLTHKLHAAAEPLPSASTPSLPSAAMAPALAPSAPPVSVSATVSPPVAPLTAASATPSSLQLPALPARSGVRTPPPSKPARSPPSNATTAAAAPSKPAEPAAPSKPEAPARDLLDSR
jgi:eukaryotic-like serine/threonine-protein kinase